MAFSTASTLYLPFTVVNSAGAPTKPDSGTLAGRLILCGSSAGTVLSDTVTFSRQLDDNDDYINGVYLASCPLSGRAIGQQVFLRVYCKVGGVPQYFCSQPVMIELNTPISAGNALATEDGSGKVDANVDVPTEAEIAAQVRVELAPELARLDVAVSSVSSAINGPGATPVTLTITDGTNPIADADVWISSDAHGANVVAGTKQTNSSGQVVFLLDVGSTYYLWMQKNGYDPILGQSFVASAG